MAHSHDQSGEVDMKLTDEKRSSRKPESQSLVDSTLEEHHGCMWALAEVEACLDQISDQNGGWLVELIDTLSRLDVTLRKHFRAEQEGPMFRKLPISHPRLAQRLQALEAEHVDILAAIEKAISKAKQMDQAEHYELREINGQVQLLVARIQRHEAAENEIVIEAHWSEVGTGD